MSQIRVLQHNQGQGCLRWRTRNRDILSQFIIRPSKGFTLVEVMVALMVAAIFVAVTMQALVSAAFFRARAEQFDEAANWIQEDLEAVINRAGQYEMSAMPYSTRCVIPPTSAVNGVAAGFLSDATGLGGTSTALGPKSFGGKSFTLLRTATTATADPYRLLQLTYTVTPEEGGPAVATITTEVIPYAVLKCP
jgi:prepilin-type N-terminal cleavage/methylation domain-containing protein